MILQAAMVAALATGQLPLATEAELPGGQKVMLAADQLVYEPAKETLIARGHTVLRTDQISLKADEVIYNQADQTAVARGNVMFVSGMLAAVADEVRVDIRSLEAYVDGGLFLKKKNVSEEDLLKARTPYELKKAGTTVLTITGTHIKKVGDNEFLVDGLSFTPCDCDPTEPSWRVEAHRAEVEVGERAILTWPVVYIYQVPIFAVPWLYVPLSERRTGLLVPRPNFTSLNGFSIDQPVFVTLGDSYDMTFTPGWYFGNDKSTFGIRGGRMHTELRYVPSEHVNGRATVGLLYDLRDRRDPLNPGVKLGTPRGLRGEASLQHVQDLGNGWRDRIDAGFISDGYYFSDVTADVLARQAEYLRSTASVYHRGTWDWFGVDAAVRQPIWTGTRPFGFDVFRPDTHDGALLRGPNTFARWPAVTWSMPERSLAGPLWGGVRAEVARLGPLSSSFGDEGADGRYGFTRSKTGAWLADADGTQGNAQFDPGEREARERFDLNPRLALPVVGRFARFTPYVAARQTVWLGEETGQWAQRSYPLAGADLGTTLLRDFGGTGEGSVRHALLPEVRLRYVPFVLGGVPGAPYDEVDAALQDENRNLEWPRSTPGAYREKPLLQAVAQVGQTFSVRRGQGYEEKLRLDLGQGFDLRARRVADTFGRLSLRHGPLSAAATARYDLPTNQITQLSASFNVDNGKGTALFASYDDLLDVGSDPMRAGIDTLLGDPLPLIPWTGTGTGYRRAQQLVGGVRTILPFGLGVRYEAVVQPLADRPLAQQLVALSYGPGCDCWRLEVHAYLRPDRTKPERWLGAPYTTDFGASLTISQFGSFGGGG